MEGSTNIPLGSTSAWNSGSDVTLYTGGSSDKDECHCKEVCSSLYHELIDFVGDDTTLAPEPKLITVQKGGCANWLWWYFGITVTLFIVLLITGTAFGCKK